jgi:Glycosyl transferases group 1
VAGRRSGSPLLTRVPHCHVSLPLPRPCPSRWEDHYRLFEALISGAMVMTDRMLSLPEGLQNGTSIVEFSSQQELGALIDYYLRHPEERVEIGGQGRLVAMSRHRSWHRMEEIIFGQRLTTCSNAAEPGTCPFVVHLDETLGLSPQEPDVVTAEEIDS